MPGPLPKADARRRNPPTVPTTNLPASGRKGRPPKVPDHYRLGKAGASWWKWAWATPQAAAWDKGSMYHLARRAQLEDDLAALEYVDNFDLAELLGQDEENDAGRLLEFVLGKLKGMAGGRLAVMKEMRELDARLGLNPEAMAKLRWKIVEDDEEPKKAAPRRRAKKAPARGPAHLRAV